jgi:hypothetical protein
MSISFIMANQLNSVFIKMVLSENDICTINDLLGLYETIAMLFYSWLVWVYLILTLLDLHLRL